MKRFPLLLTLILLLFGVFSFPDAHAQTPLLEIDYNGATVFHVLSDGRLLLPAGATDGYVLTADTDGFATWQAATGGGLSTVSRDATLRGNGTPSNPLGVAVPLVLAGGTGSGGTVYGEHSQGHRGYLGSSAVGAGGLNVSGTYGYLGGSNYGTLGAHPNGNIGFLGSTDYGAYAATLAGHHGALAGSFYGARGWNENNNRGYLGHNDYGLWATGSPWAGYFSGNVHVTGTLSKAGGSFKIDHPLDPANRYLSHSFVESPDMKNVYDGTITTDENGEAVVEMPSYFEALNRDFRYQLTVLGQFAQAIVAEKIRGNRFVIRTDQPGVEVSWQVTGIRHDRWADENRIVVEEAKPADERGRYLHPTLYGQPEAQGVGWVEEDEASRDHEAMRQQLDEERQRIQAQRIRLQNAQDQHPLLPDNRP